MTQRKPPEPRRTRKLPDADLLFVPDVAAFFDISPAAVRKRVRLNRLGPWFRLGSRYVIRRQSLERWLEAQEQKASEA